MTSNATEGLIEVPADGENIPLSQDGFIELPEDPVEPVPADGLSVIEEPAEPRHLSVTEMAVDPLPSSPVVEDVIAQQPVLTRTQLPFLGIASLPNMTGNNGTQAVASMPVLVCAHDRRLGIIVASDPGMVGKALSVLLEKQGYTGPFQFLQSTDMDRATRLEVARTIAETRVPELNQMAALALLGHSFQTVR